jgi:hypothetical protein
MEAFAVKPLRFPTFPEGRRCCLVALKIGHAAGEPFEVHAVL